jgi:hypothetical protein
MLLNRQNRKGAMLARATVDELEVRERPRVIFRVSEIPGWKPRLIKRLLAALNTAPEKVMFPAGAAR